MSDSDSDSSEDGMTLADYLDTPRSYVTSILNPQYMDFPPGPIPPVLGNLTNLTILNLSQTQLTGPIPPVLGNLTNLTILNLSQNQLTGPIPPELGNLTNLQILNLSHNDLTGNIPGTLRKLTSLVSLSLAGNFVTKVQHGTDKLGNYEDQQKITELFKNISTKTYGLKAVLKAVPQLPLEVIRDKVAPNFFGKIIKPYKKHLSRVDDKGAYFNTRFGVQKLRDDERGLYLKNGKGVRLYLYKWH